MQIQINWLLRKPTDLALHCLLRQGIAGSAGSGLTKKRLTLEAPVTTIVVCFVLLVILKVISANSVDPDQTAPLGSTLFAGMQKIALRRLQEYSADDINRQHFQMQFFLAL